MLSIKPLEAGEMAQVVMFTLQIEDLTSNARIHIGKKKPGVNDMSVIPAWGRWQQDHLWAHWPAV